MQYLSVTFKDGNEFALDLEPFIEGLSKYLYANRGPVAERKQAVDVACNYYRHHPDSVIPYARDMSKSRISPLLSIVGPHKIKRRRRYLTEWPTAYMMIKEL